MTAHAALRDLLVVDAVVERHVVYRVLLEDLVRHVETAVPGEQAARRAREHPFAAVLVNLESAADGRGDAASLVRAFEAVAGVPVVFISAGPGEVQAIPGVAAGPFDYMPAPIVPEILRGKVKLLLEMARLRDELAFSVETATRLDSEARRLAAALEEERRTANALGRLVDEQVHRGRNLLSIIQSITLRTISDGRDIVEARVALMGRLRALARAYEFLTAARARGADLTDIVEAGLGDAAERVAAAGPPVRLSGSFAQTFALAIHELATNAARHGALGTPAGTVTLGWAFQDDGPERWLEVGWTERGGPPAPPAAPSYGFGLTLVSSLAQAPHIAFGPDGFACRLRLPHDVIVGGDMAY